MKSISYWMYFQMFIGCWLLISPLVMDYQEMSGLTASNMLMGAVLIIIGLGVLLYNAFTCEEDSRMRSSLHMGQFFRKT